MRRDLYGRLRQWRSSARRKPLLLKGARQTGKTYLLKELGRKEYEAFHYFNFERDPGLDSLFEGSLDPVQIIRRLETANGVQIRPGDLLILDEIQGSNAALNSLKYFNEQASSHHVAAAGSLLGLKLSTPRSFPVGQVNLHELFPMTFFEFLDAVGKGNLRQLLEEIQTPEPLPEAFHQQLCDLLKEYYFVGGMPEVVESYRKMQDLFAVRQLQLEIMDTYVLDFAKHAPPADIPKLSLVWDSIPGHLARENKKFIFSAMKKSARARDYESAIRWLEDAGLIHRAFSVTHATAPLKGQMDTSCFKVYALDVGLLGAMSGVAPEIITRGPQLFKEFKGAFVENFAAQHLVVQQRRPLFFWRSTSVAELDFLVEVQGQVIPLEIKAGVNPKSKSLQSFDRRFNPPLLGRSTLLNLRHDNKVRNIPLYALPRVLQLLSPVLEGPASGAG